MSQTIEIHTKRVVDSNDLYRFLQGRMEKLEVVQKSDIGFYFYQDKTAIRGVDLWKEEYGYEIRTTILSSKSDVQIARYIIMYFVNFVPEATYRLEDESVNRKHIVSMCGKETFEEDATLIDILVANEASTITFYGPKGEFYIGPDVVQKLKSTEEGWQKRLEKLILKVQYELGASESDTVMEMGENEDRKILKLVHQEKKYILKKYDYLIFVKDATVATFENMIFITNEILNQNLPENWKLIDEYTIVASAMSSTEYESLVHSLLQYDCKGDFQ